VSERRARPEDIHEIAMSLPEVTVGEAGGARPAYKVKDRSFVIHRGPRKDAVDPKTGERLTDVVMFTVPTAQDKEALVGDPSTPFFTTDHFKGYNAVLLRLAQVGQLTRDELAEVVTDAWLARAPKRLARTWLAGHRIDGLTRPGAVRP